MVDVAEQETARRLVDDEANILIHVDRPEVLVFRPFDLVELQAGPRRVELQVEGGRLDGRLLVPGQPGEAVGECIGDAEFHDSTP